ncbi:hypothetical protein J3F83DRAFT_239363 [Trichoderma novae-zelandiae]
MSPKRLMLDNLAEEWVRRWCEMLQGNMNSVTQKISNDRLEEYKSCMESGLYAEGLGLAVAGLELLRAAIQGRLAGVKRDGEIIMVVDDLRPVIDEGLEWKPPHVANPAPVDGMEARTKQELNLESTFDAVVGLIAMAKATNSTSLRPLAQKVWGRIGETNGDRRNDIAEILEKRLKEIEGKIERHDRSYELPLARIYTAIGYLLKVAEKSKVELDAAFLDRVRGAVEGLSKKMKESQKEMTESQAFFHILKGLNTEEEENVESAATPTPPEQEAVVDKEPGKVDEGLRMVDVEQGGIDEGQGGKRGVISRYFCCCFSGDP